MLRVVKVRLYPTKQQETILSRHFGSVRFIYNFMLNKKIKEYEKGNKLSGYDLKKLLPIMKKEEFEWLKEIDSTALQSSVLNMDRAFQNFFKNGFGYPKFKSKHHSTQSYQSTTAKLKDSKLYLPKVGLIKTKIHREIIGKIKTVTVSYEANQYHGSILFEDGKKEICGTNNGKSIGIDVGVTRFATLSNGSFIKPIVFDKEIKKMKKAQKTLNRRKKDSANRAKAKKKLAKAHLKIRNKRKDFLHKESKKLSENQTIVVENLKIKNMTKVAKGTTQNPNMRANTKSGLNRLILQQGWYIFFEMLEYKLKRNGGELIKINPKYTSQKCNKCGHISKENRKSQSKFKCIKCRFKCFIEYYNCGRAYR